jgi:phosphatidylglycerol lysyltransferase
MNKERSVPLEHLHSKAFIVIYAVVLALISYWAASTQTLAQSSGKQVTLNLKRNKFTVVKYPSREGQPSAIILFASGDGGWSPLEDMVAQALQEKGFEVVGIDSAAYATSDYDLGTLQGDFAQIARWAESPYEANPRPLIVGGYSMGAAQAVAVAGGPNPPSGMIGLLLMDPLGRGRYGLRTSDQMNVLPTGPGTFRVSDFAPELKNIRVVQWHAANDSIDSRTWLASLSVPYKEFDLPGAGHGYDVGRNAFLVQFVKSAEWILGSSPNGLAIMGSKD